MAVLDPKVRTCLKCGRPFASQGPGNRRCPRCSQKDLEYYKAVVVTPIPSNKKVIL